MKDIWKATLKTTFFSFLILSTLVLVVKNVLIVDLGINMIFIITVHLLALPLLYLVYSFEKNKKRG
jgi:Ca2+/Na+ antiporter